MAVKETLQLVINATDNGARNVLQGIASVAGGILGAAVFQRLASGVMDFGRESLAAGIRMEGLRSAFEGITVDAEKTLQTLREGALGMVSDADLVETYNKAYQLVGQTFADQLPSAMGYLSKISAATGQDMAYLLNSLTTGVGRLSPMILDNLAIQVNLTEANEAYAKTLGKSVDEMTKSEQQAALMAQVMEKLAENTAKMPDISENAATKMAQMRAQMENFRAQIGEAFLPVWTTLMGLVAQFATVILPLVAPALETVAGWLSEKLPPAIAVVSGLFNGIVGILRDLFAGDWSGAVDAFMEMFFEIAGALGLSKEQVMEWALTVYNALRDVVAWVQGALATIKGVWEVVWPYLKDYLAVVWENIKVLVKGAWDFVKGLFTAGRQALEGDWAGAWATLQATALRFLGTIVEVVRNKLDLVLGWFGIHRSETERTVSGLWATVTGYFQTALDWVTNAVNTALTWMRGWWAEHGENVKTVVSAWWDYVVNVFNIAKGIVTGIVDALVSYGTWLWETFGDEIMEATRNTWEMVKTLFREAGAVLGDIIDAIAAVLRGDWRAFGEELRSITEHLWTMVKTAFETGWANLSLIVGQIVDSLKGWFTSVDWGEVGRGILDGISNGIRNGIDAIKNAARDAAQAALDAAKGFLGINSPSTVFAGIGENMMQGMALGIQGNAGLPAMASQQAAARAAHVTNNYTYNVSGNYAYQSQRTITDEVRMLSMLARA